MDKSQKVTWAFTAPISSLELIKNMKIKDLNSVMGGENLKKDELEGYMFFNKKKRITNITSQVSFLVPNHNPTYNENYYENLQARKLKNIFIVENMSDKYERENKEFKRMLEDMAKMEELDTNYLLCHHFYIYNKVKPEIQEIWNNGNELLACFKHGFRYKDKLEKEDSEADDIELKEVKKVKTKDDSNIDISG